MAKGDLQINSILLPLDDIQYKPGWIDYEVTDRTINRTLVSDFIAFKRTFDISWKNPLEGSFLADLLDLYLAKEDVTFTETAADLTTTAYTCRMSISNKYLREIMSGNYAFSGFSITLEEV
jgi:hypothetical protein